LTESSAWACLATNLVVLPGVGSWIAGQREAVAQVVVACLGMVLMTGWLVWFVFSWIHHQRVPVLAGPFHWGGVLGVVLFLFAWCWSLVSGLQLVRQTRKNQSAGPPPAGGGGLRR
jgi:hypothetical protein